jgi:hypothetical protein
MVLIIRNNRIQTRRHSRIKNFLSYVVPKNRRKVDTEKEKESSFIMSNIVRILGTFYIYSIAMFTLPFIAFFGVQHILITEFHTERFVTNCISIVAAVLVVNIIIGFYAYQALHEQDENDESSRLDDGSDSSEDKNKKTD